jgi:hypothetical protein
VAINWDELTPEEILATAKQLEKTATEAEKGIEALTDKRDQLLVEVKKRKKAMRLLGERGIDPTKPDFDDKLAELLASVDDYAENGSASGGGNNSGSGNPPAPGMGQPDTSNLPADMNPEIKQMLERMTSKITNLETTLGEERKKLEEKDKEADKSLLKNTVIDKLMELGMKKKRAEHLFKLTEEKYKLSDDGKGNKFVVGGDEYDPVSLDTVIGNLRDSDDYGDYFPGSGNSGSGLQASQGSRPAVSLTENPFVTGNATEAARIMSDNPVKGKQMMNQARAAGKLDKVLGEVFGDK